MSPPEGRQPMDVGHPAGATSPVRRETLVEIVGYVGAASAVAGTVTVFARNADLSDGASLTVTLGVAAVLVIAGLAIGDRSPDAYQRMRSILWFVAVESFGFASGIFWLNIADLGAKTAATLAGLTTSGVRTCPLADAPTFVAADRVLRVGGRRRSRRSRCRSSLASPTDLERTAPRDLGVGSGVVRRRNGRDRRGPRGPRASWGRWPRCWRRSRCSDHRSRSRSR